MATTDLGLLVGSGLSYVGEADVGGRDDGLEPDYKGLTIGAGHSFVGEAVIGAPELALIVLSASSNITASGENTTAQLTAPSGKTTSDFGGGRIQDDENPTDAVDIGSNQYREDEW